MSVQRMVLRRQWKSAHPPKFNSRNRKFKRKSFREWLKDAMAVRP